jgi:coenzyme F420-dependent glucose-6-phosphate dehydrogenase
MRQLWTEDRVSFEGDYYVTDRATIYDKPEKPVPIYIAAWAPLATKYAGRAGDGFICTSGKDPDAYIERKANLEEGATSAGRDPSAIEKVIEIKVAYDHDVAYAKDSCRWWAALSLSAEEKSGVEDAVEMERLADAAADRAHGRFIVSDDADDVVEQIGTYVDLGFKHLVFHAPGADQERFLKQFCADVVPKLREKW